MAFSKPTTWACAPRRRLRRRDDGVEQGDVLTDVAGDVGEAIEEQTDPGGVRVEPDQNFFEVWVARGAVDLAVHVHVVTPHLAWVGGVVDLGDARSQRGQSCTRLGGGCAGGAGGRDRFQLFADSEMSARSVKSTAVAKVPRRE